MRPRHVVMLAALGLLAPFASPASAGVACVVQDWTSGDTCTFEPVAGAFHFSGWAPSAGPRSAWVSVEVVFNGVVIASCYGTAIEPLGNAYCFGDTQAFAPTLTHVCRVYGTGGGLFHCADPPPLPATTR